MRTVYVDVYFLINFTVDMLALHFASSFSKVRVGVARLFICALVGGGVAVATVFIPDNIVYFSALSIGFFAFIILFCAKGAGVYRRFKLLLAFLIFEIFFAGTVYALFYGLKRLAPNIGVDGELENRRFLILAILVLLTFGILKLLFSVFSGIRAEEKVSFEIVLNGRRVVAEALLDTGNLLRDPMSSTPVLLVKPRLIISLFPSGMPNINSKASNRFERIRVIPVREGEQVKLLTGFVPNESYILKKEKRERITITVAIDNIGGSFGGYDALMPSAAVENVL